MIVKTKYIRICWRQLMQSFRRKLVTLKEFKKCLMLKINNLSFYSKKLGKKEKINSKEKDENNKNKGRKQ